MSDERNVGTISTMGWEKDEETGQEVFYAHVRFPGIPHLSPRIVWDAVPVEVVPQNRELIQDEGGQQGGP
jgi:hypothetical protein